MYVAKGKEKRRSSKLPTQTPPIPAPYPLHAPTPNILPMASDFFTFPSLSLLLDTVYSGKLQHKEASDKLALSAPRSSS